MLTMTRIPAFATAAMCSGIPAQGAQQIIVPSAYATVDANSYQWIAGASRDVRQQTLIGSSHLTSLIGRPLLALELRRTVADETYSGGSAQLSVALSTSPSDPLSCSPLFATNVGMDEVQVFNDVVSIPASPPELGPTVGWDVDNTVRIEFDIPFVYLGGTLCIDVVGHPVSGQNANWWMADAVSESITGSTVDLGGGCGSYGGTQHSWGHVAPRTLIAGAQARFYAYNDPWTIGVAVFGDGMTGGIPMSWLGFPSPAGCEIHLSTIVLMSPVVFEPDPNPALAHRGGLAEVRLPFANDGSFLGLTFTTQWVEIQQWQTSNAIQWTSASSVPQLDMALIEGHPSEAAGELSVHLAHVFRMEYQ